MWLHLCYSAYFLVLQDFNNIEQYISHCFYLSTNDTLLRTDNCSVKQDYKCTSESCLNICGQLYDSSLPCQCNTACTEYGNCCNDYDKSCPKEFCVGSCGQPYNKTHRCHCNEACKTNQYCCDDYDVFCLLRVNESSTTEYIKSETTFITSEFYEESTSRPTTSLWKDTDMIVGIVVSVSVIKLTIVVILCFLYWRKYSKEQLSFNSASRNYRNINERDTRNDTVMSDYQQLDDISDEERKTKAYDQLHVTRIVEPDPSNGQSNTSFSREVYCNYELIEDSINVNKNTVTSKYEQLDKANKDTKMTAYDQLHVVYPDPTNCSSKTMDSKEGYLNHEPVEEDTAVKKNIDTSEYEQLDNNKTDKSMNVYDQLNI